MSNPFARRNLAALAGAVLVLGLGGCGKKDSTAEMTQGDDMAGPAAEPGGMGGAAGGIGTAGSAAMTSYLAQTGADAKGQSFPLDQVGFESGASTLDAADKAALGEVAGVIKQHPNAAVTVTSHVEPGGDAAANKKLAAARAVSVKNGLAEAGVPADRLMTNVVDTAAAGAPVELLLQRR